MENLDHLRILNSVNYSRVSSVMRSYAEFISSPIKLSLDFGASRRMFLNPNDYFKENEIQNGVIIPEEFASRNPINMEELFLPLDGYYVFNNDRNTGSDILGDYPHLFTIQKKELCYEVGDNLYSLDKYKNSSLHQRIIPHPGHKCLADLMKWGHCYKFENNQWVYDENKKNHLIKFKKGRIRIRVADEVGDTDERISDYSKLIYWLLCNSGSNLPPILLEKVELLTPDIKQIEKIIERDLLVRSIVNEELNEKLPDHYEFEL